MPVCLYIVSVDYMTLCKDENGYKVRATYITAKSSALGGFSQTHEVDYSTWYIEENVYIYGGHLANMHNIPSYTTDQHKLLAKNFIALHKLENI